MDELVAITKVYNISDPSGFIEWFYYYMDKYTTLHWGQSGQGAIITLSTYRWALYAAANEFPTRHGISKVMLGRKNRHSALKPL